MKFQKQLLRPGRFVLGPNLYAYFTRADIVSLATRVQRMKALGLRVPLVDGHQQRAIPMSRGAAQALGLKVLGHLNDATVDGKGVLVGTFDVPNQAAAGRCKAVRFVSCQITPDTQDSDGRVWAGGSLSHIALTPRPVVPQSDHFTPVALSLSDLPRGISLSLANRKDSNMADNDLFDEGELAGDTGDAGNLSQLLDEIASFAKAAKSMHRGTPPDFLADHIDDLTAMRDWLKVFSEGGDPRADGDQAEQQPEGTPTAETPLALSRRSTGGSRPAKESCASYILRKFNGITAKK